MKEIKTVERVYIASGMTGYKWYNFLEFDRVRDYLRKLGYTVISPADIDRANGFDATHLPPDFDWKSVPEGIDMEEVMLRDLEALNTCDAIYLFGDWKSSKGAMQEHDFAMKRGLVVWTDEDMIPDRFSMASKVEPVQQVKVESQTDGRAYIAASDPRYSERGAVLDEAKSLICGDRNASYGPPHQDFKRTADMMNGLFGWMLKDGCKFKARDVAWIMIMVKASRSQHCQKRDNYVDAAGYAACGWECETAEGR